MIMGKFMCVILLLFISSCDYSNKEVLKDIDENMSNQSKLDSIKDKFDRFNKELESDSIPEYVIDDKKGVTVSN